MSSDLARSEELFEQGKSLFFHGQYARAAQLLATAAELSPTSVGCQFMLGASRLNSNDITGALYPLALCVYFEPGHGSGRFALGMTLRYLGQPEQAAVHLAYAAYLGNPQAPATLTQLGLAHCPDCGGPVTSETARCDICAGIPRPISPPRPRTWSWTHLRADDFRSRLSLPCEQVAHVARGHLDRYVQQGDPHNIDDAITYLELAAAAAPYVERPLRLTELGSAYRQRSACHGLSADLDHAVDCHEQALDLADANAAERVMILVNLGLAYGARNEFSAVATDLKRAIECLEKAMDTPTQDPDQRLAAMANAGLFYQRRFQSDSDSVDLDRSIELQISVVDATPPDHPRYAGRMANLAVACAARYEKDGRRADLDRALDLADRAVAATPGDSPALPIRLSVRGDARLHRYLTDRGSGELDRAIKDLRQALDATPDGHPQVAPVVAQLARAHLVPGAQALAPDRQTLEAWEARLESARGASPSGRALAGRNLGTLANACGQYDLAARVLDVAVKLMPAVPLRGTSWTDRERRFGEHRGLVSQAFAAHCALLDPLRAVQQAELGRGMQLATVLDAHDDLTDLDRELPQLARPFRQVRKELAGSSASQSVFWDRYGDLVARIREHPGFTRFLMTPRVEELRRAAAGGTVVLVNCGRDRADAILIRSEGDLQQVPLPGLSSSDVEAQAESMVDSAHTGRGDRMMADRLAWLWDTVVRPVGDAFPSGNTPHRVWWLPIGLLGLFPLHAAGHPGRPGALDAFVSSYTPTLRILAHAHDRPSEAARRQLTVALSNTSGLPGLPGALAEALDLHRRHPDQLPLLNQDATIGQVAAGLSTATWAHFACHALADYSAPSNGGLCLTDGVLTIPEISRLTLADTQLAYLSACSTGYRNLEHVDESLNLASAFQLAGFRHVIASLWPLNDSFGAVVSRTFYGELSGAADDSPRALHQTTLELRRQYPDRPDLWASLIHSGP
ncbi:CHAT domain-containing protein/tetratricopeptide (TPR) repeat protein [Kitasatospora sp. MAA19]|uniref:CHAT domain-containing protein n=1 Tax=Kitasatospora sp. MAA19 TaxID=3035090 RepID=UPI0024766D94|nr:CHAT domain-containing protein [Kitasatospora sp. MAA19]MDH6710135.1 CHAT domain-containing protein/tetratricopeptide (TPR) repeat protein [Kitasatospora sp. MAA19]